MRTRHTSTAAVLVGAILLSGCAATVYDGKYDWSEGWRSAEVVEVAAASEMERPRFYDCVRRATPEKLATTKFAVVKYRSMSRTQRRAVPLAQGQTLRAGDPVLVQVETCDPAVERRDAGK
jgi:hypothetical protein